MADFRILRSGIHVGYVVDRAKDGRGWGDDGSGRYEAWTLAPGAAGFVGYFPSVTAASAAP